MAARSLASPIGVEIAACPRMLLLTVLSLCYIIMATFGSVAYQHACDRECSGSAPMTCRYNLTIESYATLSKACYYCPFVRSDCLRDQCIPVDGFSRMLYTVNRQFPSPQIRVCENDTLEVLVKNHMSHGEATTMHWHGIYQRGTVFMDGVPMVTQCPITSGTEFLYRFEAYPSGTHWYHSHVGAQRGDGIAGALIIKPRSDPHALLFTDDIEEHTVLLQDWFRATSAAQSVLHLHAKATNRPDMLLINGRFPGNVTWPTWSRDPPQPDAQTPYAVFNVTLLRAYRFRVISNILMNCPVEVRIEGHRLKIIASDGENIDPIDADVLVISGGERWDFVLNATKPVNNYWVYARGLTDCSQRKTQTLGILRYTGTSQELPQSTPDSYDQRPKDVVTVNPFSEGMVDGPKDTDLHVTLTELRSLKPAPDWLTSTPDKVVHLELGLHRTDNPHFNVPELYSWESQINIGGGTVLAQINRVSSVFPAWPLLTQYFDVPNEHFCDLDSEKVNEDRCTRIYCSCIHRVKINLGDVVELMLIDRGEYWNISNHAMHIHGQHMHIIAIGQSPLMETNRNEFNDKHRQGIITRNFQNPILKDTVMMPDGGFIIARFKADNPGPWFLHCHNEVHVEQGMSIILEVGDPKSWPQPKGVHSCGAAQKATIQDASGFGSPTNKVERLGLGPHIVINMAVVVMMNH